MRIVFFACCLCLFYYNISAQESSISREQALEDLEKMVSTISETHPDMYANISEELFIQEVEQVKSSFPEKLSPVNFYKRAAPLVTMLGDGHTSLWPFSILESMDFFPWEVTIAFDTYKITTKDDQKEIISINGIKSQDIVKNMLDYSSGELMPFRIIKLSNLFQYYMTALYYADAYHIEFMKDGLVADTIVTPISSDKISKPFLSDLEPYSYWLAKEDRVAVMDFNLCADKEGMQVFLDSMFTDMKERKIKTLIIDIRNNGGGASDIGDEVFQYISPVPFEQYGKTLVRISPLARNSYSYYSDRTDGYEVIEQDEPISLRDNPLRCAGEIDIYLLTSSYTFSSASSFAWAFQYFDMGTIVGEETGGSIVSFGDMLMDTLPNSKVLLGVSFKKFYLYDVEEDVVRGVIPDIKIPAEKALEYVLENIIE